MYVDNFCHTEAFENHRRFPARSDSSEVAMFLFVAPAAFATDTLVLVGSENRIGMDGVTSRAKGVIDVSIVDRLSVTATLVVTPDYGEAYIGPTWMPSEHFSLGIAGGIEIADDPWRVAGTLYGRHKRLWALGIVEYGGTGLWYKALASYDVGPVSLGVLAQRFDGIGPRIAGSYKGFELWAAPLYDPEAQVPNLLVGLNWTP